MIQDVPKLLTDLKKDVRNRVLARTLSRKSRKKLVKKLGEGLLQIRKRVREGRRLVMIGLIEPIYLWQL